MAIIGLIVVVALLVTVQERLYRRFWSKKLSLSLEFSTKTVFEGEKLFLTEKVSNAKILPLPWLCVKLQLSRKLFFIGDKYDNIHVSDYLYRNDLYSVMFYQKITRKLPLICLSRGYYTIKSADLVSSNILISEKLIIPVPCNTSVTVYPKLINTPLLEFPFQKIYGAVLTKRFINPDPFEFRGMREYEPYDDFKSINYKASARVGKLMVNLYGYTNDMEVLLILNLQKYSAWSSELIFEDSIRLAASLAKLLLEKGISVGLLSNGRDIITDTPIHIKPGSGSNHLLNIYEALARIDLGKEALPFEASQGDPSVISVFISTNHEPQTLQFYERLQSAGWILPYFREMTIKLPIDYVPWEVIWDDQGQKADSAAL